MRDIHESMSQLDEIVQSMSNDDGTSVSMPKVRSLTKQNSSLNTKSYSQINSHSGFNIRERDSKKILSGEEKSE